MTLLKDDELAPLINAPAGGAQPLVTGLPHPPMLPVPAGAPAGAAPPDPWYGPKSAIQASSLDLHIGAILVPGVEEDEPGSVTNPEPRIVLQCGETVVITTQEQLNMPDTIAGIGFPPAHLSSRGLLMTNPGHVDPGFSGRLRFTVMNIGKKAIDLRAGDEIVTLLFFRLTAPAHSGWAQRQAMKAPPGAVPAPDPTQAEVNELSRDFLDVTNRARKEADKAVKDAEKTVQARFAFWGPLVGVFGTLVVTGLGLFSVKSDVDTLKKVLDLKEPKSQEIDKLQQRIDVLEQQAKPKPGPKDAGGNP